MDESPAEPNLGARVRPSIWRMAAAALPVLIIVAVLASGLTGGRGPVPGASPMISQPPVPSAPDQTPDLIGAPALPSRLAFIITGLHEGGGGRLGIVEGAGTDVITPRAGRRAVSFTWSPGGAHLVVVDAAGGLRLLPEDVRMRGPVRDVVFSHDGRSLAICRGGPRPWLSVVRASADLDAVVPGVRGCDPAWSADDTYVSYLIPGGPADRAGRRMVVNSRLNVRFPVPGTGPLVWAPPDSYVLTQVTTLAPDCVSVQAMEPNGGRRHLLATIPFLAPRPAGSTAPCRVTMMAWSPDARWLAVAIRPRDGASDRVIVFEPRSHSLVPLPVDELELTPRTLSWSPRSDALLVTGVRADGRPLTFEAVPSGDRRSERFEASNATWSPDGAWILGLGPTGWAAFEAIDTSVRVPLSAIPADATLAQWCCPAIPVVQGPTPD